MKCSRRQCKKCLPPIILRPINIGMTYVQYNMQYTACVNKGSVCMTPQHLLPLNLFYFSFLSYNNSNNANKPPGKRMIF